MNSRGLKIRAIAVVPAAGSGERLGRGTKKPFIGLGGRPLVSYALTALGRSPLIDAIVIACEDGFETRMRSIAKKFCRGKAACVVTGGATRYESVGNCLRQVSDEYDIVLIHDGARPFLQERLIREAIFNAARYGAAITAVPESDTVKTVDGEGFVSGTLDRSLIFRIQTPQAFRTAIIKEAYRKAVLVAPTDDALLIEAMGRKVKIVDGSRYNIKITAMEDLLMARKLMKLNRARR